MVTQKDTTDVVVDEYGDYSEPVRGCYNVEDYEKWFGDGFSVNKLYTHNTINEVIEDEDITIEEREDGWVYILNYKTTIGRFKIADADKAKADLDYGNHKIRYRVVRTELDDQFHNHTHLYKTYSTFDYVTLDEYSELLDKFIVEGDDIQLIASWRDADECPFSLLVQAINHYWYVIKKCASGTFATYKMTDEERLELAKEEAYKVSEDYYLPHFDNNNVPNYDRIEQDCHSEIYDELYNPKIVEQRKSIKSMARKIKRLKEQLDIFNEFVNLDGKRRIDYDVWLHSRKQQKAFQQK